MSDQLEKEENMDKERNSTLKVKALWAAEASSDGFSLLLDFLTDAILFLLLQRDIPGF